MENWFALLCGCCVLAAACSGGDDTAPLEGDAAVDAGSSADADVDGGDASVRNSAGLSGFVSFNLMPDADCIFDASPGTTFYPAGLYDLERRTDDASDACDQPYRVHLLAMASFEPDAGAGTAVGDAVLQIHSASVELMTSERKPIAFDAVAPPLPNPFLVTTSNTLALTPNGEMATAIAAVEAIPLAYAAQLTPFVGSQILAEIRLLGTTTGDEDLDFRPFVYPIELCAGCLIVCETDLPAPRDEVLGDGCADQAGADGRICIESGC